MDKQRQPAIPGIGRKMEAHISENSRKVLEARYLKKDNGKVIEKPEDLFWRVATTIASAEKMIDPKISDETVKSLEFDFYNLMATGTYMPNSPTLMNAGREMGMLSACFVLPVEDSINGIFKTMHDTALIQKAGGGTGFDFSRLRPKGDYVKSSGGITPGPLTFLELYSHGTAAIQQGAFRRGANMGILRIDHPDVIEFIEFKEDLSKITNFNISVTISDEFMEKLKRNPNEVHIVINPRNAERKPLAKKDSPGKFWTVGEVFDLIVNRAWSTGEPGVCFIDEINRANPTPHIGKFEATNPCGEQPLLPYEACNLGSINVGIFVEKDASGKYQFNWDQYTKAIHLSTRFLDNVVEVNNYPIPEIEKMCRGNRKIGLGVMGLSDAMFKLGIQYDSDAGVAFGEKIMQVLNDETHNASSALAEVRGSFPYWKGSEWELKSKRPMRNACSTTVAPTGTISIIADCSCGIEPLFSLAFFRNLTTGKYVEINPIFVEMAKERGFFSQELIEKIAQIGTINYMEEIPADIRKIFRCAHDISPEWHIKMQAVFQKHCDSSISKTTNFSAGATAEDVRKVYIMAYDYKLKGVTVYRDGSRNFQPMALDNNKSVAKDDARKKELLQKVGASTPAASVTV